MSILMGSKGALLCIECKMNYLFGITDHWGKGNNSPYTWETVFRDLYVNKYKSTWFKFFYDKLHTEKHLPN